MSICLIRRYTFYMPDIVSYWSSLYLIFPIHPEKDNNLYRIFLQNPKFYNETRYSQLQNW